jgi:IS1 family transposase
VRITGIAKNTVARLLREAGQACLDFQDKMLCNITSQRIQIDEVWCFCYAKDKNVPERMRGMAGVGSVWTYTAIDAESKLIISWQLGARDAANANAFMQDVAERVVNRFQLTTDGNNCYLDAVHDHFGPFIDYSMLVKLYGPVEAERTYSPAKCLGTRRKKIFGEPDPAHVSTSYSERSNLTMRMAMRRFTRLTNGFSKKAEMLAYSLALHFMYYNFIRFHQTLRMPPALKAGIIDRALTIDDIVHMLPLLVAKKRPV